MIRLHESDENLQNGNDSLPSWESVRYCPLSDNPPTEDEWNWVVLNRGLVLSLVNAYRRDAFYRSHYSNGDDVVTFLLPTILRCLRSHDPAQGELATLLGVAIKRILAHRRNGHRYQVVKTKFGERSARCSLLGDRDEDVPDRDNGERDREEAEEYRGFLASRLGWLKKPRDREIFDSYLGLTGDHKTVEDLSEEHGLTRQRIYQVISTSLLKVMGKAQFFNGRNGSLRRALV